MDDLELVNKGFESLDAQPTLNQTIKSTPEWGPDEHAQDMRLGRDLGLPPTVVKTNRDAALVDSQFKRLSEQQIKKDAPALDDRIRNDPDFAIVAKDDIEGLYAAGKKASGWGETVATSASASVDATASGIGGLIQKAGQDAVLPKLETDSFWGGITLPGQILDAAIDVGVGLFKQNVVGKENLEATREFGAEMSADARAEMQRKMSTLHLEDLSAKKAVSTFLVSSLPLVASAVTTAVTRSPAAGAAVMGGHVYGAAYDEGINVLGLPPEEASNRAVYHAAAEAIPEMLPLGFAVAGGQLALKPILKRYAGGILSEAGQEMITEVLQTGIDAGLYGQDITLKQAIINTLEAGMAGGIGGGAISSVGTAATAVNSIQHSRIQKELDAVVKAEGGKASLEELAEKVRKTKMFGRDKEMVAQFIEGAADVKAVHVDATGLSDTYTRLGQEQGDAMLKELGIEDQVFQAEMTGGDFVIPLQNVVKSIDSEYFPDLADNLRVTPAAMTAKEAKKSQEHIKEIEAEAEQIMETAVQDDSDVAEAEALAADIERQLVKTGMSQADARSSSLLHRDFALVMGRRAGISPSAALGALTVNRAQYDPVADALPTTAEEEIAQDLGIDLGPERFGSELPESLADIQVESTDDAPPLEVIRRAYEAGTLPLDEQQAADLAVAVEQNNAAVEEKNGLAFRDFFSSVVTGAAGVSNTGVPYQPVIPREDLGEFAVEYEKHRGNFDDHIAFSIPGYKEVQMAVGSAISRTVGPETAMLDIGASEGSIGKTISALGGPKTVSLDPNPDMAEAFASHSKVDGASYAMAAFTSKGQEGQPLWKEGDVDVMGFVPEGKYGVIHEAMTFQFIDNNRAEQLDRIVELLEDDGLVVMEEKFHNDNWAANEAKKDKQKSLYFEAKDMTEKAKAILEGMNENMVQDKAFEKMLAERFDYVVQFWDAGNFKGYAASNDPAKLAAFAENVGDVQSEFASVATPRRPEVRLGQSATLRRGKEDVTQYGLKSSQRYSTREVAMALEARQISKFGHIAKGDHSDKSVSDIAKWMVKEIKFELEHPEDSGIGWYSEKFQRALDTMGATFPELLTDQSARDMFTALIAITSDGQKVQTNFQFASDLYADYRATGKMNPAIATGNSAKSIRINLENLNKLIEQFGTGGALHDHLLQEMSVKELRQWARDNNVDDFKVDYLSDVKLPLSTGVFGPKLGAFYANLMGAHGYLTMDRWWMRTINRYRGELIPTPTAPGMARFRELLAEAGLDVVEYSNEDLVFATLPYQRSYEQKGFKNGTAIEKAANTIHKAAFVALRDSPENAADRSFMLAAANRAKKNLKRSGIDMTLADIQATLWYYEKRLYGELGARASADISYEEAALRAVNGTLDQTGLNIEVAPNPQDLTLTHAFDQLTPQAKLEATQDVAEKVVRDMAAKLGFPEADIQYANGGYLDLVNPSLIVSSPGASFEDLRDLGLVLGEVFSQESILVYDESATKSKLRGKKRGSDLVEHVRLAPSRALSREEQENLYQHIRSKVNGLDGFTWRDGAMVFADVSGIGDQFEAQIFEALKDAPLNEKIVVTHKKFRSQLLEIEDGNASQGKESTGTDILRTRSGDDSASTDTYREQAAAVLRQHLSQTYGQSQPKPPALSDLSLSVDPEGELRTDRDGMVPLHHWGKIEGQTVVDPEKQGTGAAGQEKRRVDRPPRSYWGLPGYRLEAGPGSLTTGRAFTRVNPDSLYDLNEDPDGLRALVKAENPGLIGEGLFTAFEQKIKDSGYLGFWGTQPGNGPVAAIFEKVEIDTVHPRETKHKDGTSWVAGYDAAGNGYGDSIRLGQTVYHGTGNNNPYDKFRTSAIEDENNVGGEGFQAFGWGLYFAEEYEVSDFYRRKNEDGVGTGRMYTVEMDIMQDEMLHWETSLEGQPQAVKDMVESLSLLKFEYEGQPYTSFQQLVRANRNLNRARVIRKKPKNGRQIYHMLSDRLGSDKAASLKMLEYGIQAVRYPDADSRNQAARWDFDAKAEVPDSLRNAVYDMNRANEGVPKSRQVVSPGAMRGFLRSKGLPQSEIELFNEMVNEGALVPSQGSYNYVVFDDSKVSITSFEQQLKGDITFAGESQIRLFETADMSTFLHESGHHFLERMRVLAQGSPEIRQDLNAVMKWMGVNHSREIGRDQHEMFARGFEAYLREGKAPGKDLNGVFARFRDWLVTVYKSLTELNVDLTEEVRGVMDRMLRTDEVFSDTEMTMGTSPMFKSAEDAGMTDAEYEDYIERAMESRDISRAKLDSVMVETEMKRLSAEWKADVEKERQREMDELAGSTTYTSRAFLQGKVGIEGLAPFKLDRDEIEASYDEEVIRNLPRGVNSISVSNGMPLDEAAELLGYESGDALIKDQAAHKELNIEALERARETVSKEKGFAPKNPVELEFAAQDALMHRDRAELIFTELKALDRVTGGKGIPRKVLKNTAKRMVSEMKVSELTPGKYLAASIRKAKESASLLAKKDMEGAAKAKREQILNHLLYMQVRDARNNLDGQRRFFRKFDRPGVRENLATDYLEQIDNLLETYDFKQVSAKVRGKRAALSAFVAEKMAAGEEVLVPPDAIERASQINFKDLTVQQLRELQDWVKNLEHLARLKSKLLSAKQAREFEAARDEGIASLKANNEWKEQFPDYNDNVIKRVRKYTTRFFSNLVNMEFLTMKADGGKRGWMWENLWLPTSKAQDTLAVRKVAASAEIKRIMKKHGVSGSSLRKKTMVGAVGTSMSLESRLAVVLNMGNIQGMQRLTTSAMGPDGSTWSEQQLTEIADSLDANQMALVQDILDHVDSYWGEVYDLQKELTGVPPEKVEALPIKSRHGTIRGGYYPLKYDSDFSEATFKQDSKASVQEMMGGNFSRAMTRRGHTEARIDKLARKVRTDLGVLDQHISEVLLDLTHRKPIMDAVKLTQDPKMANALKATIGLEAYREINPWLMHVANSYKKVQNAGAFVKVMEHLRIGTSVVGLGLRFSTALINFTGIFPALVEIRNPGIILQQMAMYAAHPKKTWAFVSERSEMMQTRSKVFDREVSEQLRNTELLPIWYSLIAKVDQIVTTTTWMSAYEQGMHRENNDEAKAIAYADSVVRTTQSSGRAADLSAVQRPSQEILKMMTVFYSYFNMIYNQSLKSGRKLVGKGNSLDTRMEFIGDMVALWILPALVGQLIAGRGPDDDEDWEVWAAKELALYATASIPIVRDVAGGVIGDYGYKFTPVGDAGVNVSRAIRKTTEAVTGEGDWVDVRKPLLNSAGYLFHLPTGQLNKTIDTFENGDDLTLRNLLLGAPKE